MDYLSGKKRTRRLWHGGRSLAQRGEKTEGRDAECLVPTACRRGSKSKGNTEEKSIVITKQTGQSIDTVKGERKATS